MNNKDNKKVIAQNKRAYFDYLIESTIEAGIILTGSEVKSLRAGKVSIQESYAGEINQELFLLNAFISEYPSSYKFNHEPKRKRKLLLKHRELNKLLGLIKQKGMSIVPISLYFNKKGIAKIKIGVAKGKKKIDKRETEKKRTWQKTKEKILKEKNI